MAEALTPGFTESGRDFQSESVRNALAVAL
jgi:hypothetical protein